MKLLRLTILFAFSCAIPCFPAAIFDGSPGTAAPPGTLGSYLMTSFPLNTADPPPGSPSLTSIPSPLGGTLSFSSGLEHRRAGPSGPYTGWGGSVGWGQGYSGDVYYGPTLSMSRLTVALPAGTGAYYFCVQPEDDSRFGNFFVSTSDNGASGVVSVFGIDHARYYGFYETTPGASFDSITISPLN